MTLLAGAGIGAAIMYLADPQSGGNRRHTLGRSAQSALHGVEERIGHAIHSTGDARTKTKAIGFALLGAACMWLLDPTQGRRRRALVRDKTADLAHDTTDLIHRTGRYVGDKVHGAAAVARSMLHPAPVDDEILAEHVRSQLGHLITNAGQVFVAVDEGSVTLSGPVDEADCPTVQHAIGRIPGVRELHCRFEAPADPSRHAEASKE
jgi:gas vesicle protein